jgi:hypothetical protein
VEWDFLVHFFLKHTWGGNTLGDKTSFFFYVKANWTGWAGAIDGRATWEVAGGWEGGYDTGLNTG